MFLFFFDDVVMIFGWVVICLVRVVWVLLINCVSCVGLILLVLVRIIW